MSRYKELQIKVAIITESKVTDFFCMADDFCKFYDAVVEKYSLPRRAKHKDHRKSTLSKAEVMMILILFYDSEYCSLKHFYLDEVCKYLRHLFPKVVSYNYCVELEKRVAIPLTLFIKKVLMVKMLTEHESNMRKFFRRNESLWFSDFWMKVLVIFLFIYSRTWAGYIIVSHKVHINTDGKKQSIFINTNNRFSERTENSFSSDYEDVN